MSANLMTVKELVFPKRSRKFGSLMDQKTNHSEIKQTEH